MIMAHMYACSESVLDFHSIQTRQVIFNYSVRDFAKRAVALRSKRLSLTNRELKFGTVVFV